MSQIAFVTGATGFVGGHLVSRLLQEGFQVRCLVRSENAMSPDMRQKIDLVRGDLLDQPSLDRGTKGATLVFHCAAMVTDWATIKELKACNVEGTQNLLRAASEGGVKRFVHISTTDVYRHRGVRGVTEEAETDHPFSNWYSETKSLAERCVLDLEAQGGMEWVIVRPGTVFGPGSINVVGEIAKALRSRTMLLIRKGQSVAGLCYIDNLVDLLLLVGRHEDCVGEMINVCDGNDVTWKKFLDDLAVATGLPKPWLNLPYGVAFGLGFVMECGYRLLRKTTGLRLPALLSRQAVEVMGKHQDFSIRKAEAMLGFKPRAAYAEAMSCTASWLKQEVLK